MSKKDKAAVLELRQRCSDIAKLCNKAGKPELLQTYIDQNLSPGEASGKLLAMQTGKVSGPILSYESEYKLEQAHYERQGISMADYVYSRRVDDGLESLPFASEKK